MIRILLLSGSLASGGAERQMVTIAGLLKEKGYNVEVACYGYDDFYAHLLDEKGIKINWLVTDNNLFKIMKVRTFIRHRDYDAVISFLEVPDFLNNISAIGGRKWKIITGERSAKKTTFTSRRGKLFAWFQRYTDAIVCNSENGKNMWLENYPQYRDKLITIYNSVTLQSITSNYIPQKDGKSHIVIAASYQYLKNTIGLIKALSLLNEEERKKIEINWYGRIEVSKGDTRAYDEAVSLINENNLQEVINLNEDTKDITNKMNEADVVALFSSVEGLPNAICEGMMIGKPIIMSRVSDYSILVDETNGFLCDWDNIESIKEALLSAMNLTLEQLIDMGDNSRKKAEKLFSCKCIVEKWENLFILNKN